MNDELRDRIADVLHTTDDAYRNYGEMAQAVIDDLGLKEPRSSVNDPLMVRFETKAFRRGRP